MCNECTLQLGAAYAFKEQCLKSDAQLKEMIWPTFEYKVIEEQIIMNLDTDLSTQIITVQSTGSDKVLLNIPPNETVSFHKK